MFIVFYFQPCPSGQKKIIRYTKLFFYLLVLTDFPLFGCGVFAGVPTYTTLRNTTTIVKNKCYLNQHISQKLPPAHFFPGAQTPISMILYAILFQEYSVVSLGEVGYPLMIFTMKSPISYLALAPSLKPASRQMSAQNGKTMVY